MEHDQPEIGFRLVDPDDLAPADSGRLGPHLNARTETDLRRDRRRRRQHGSGGDSSLQLGATGARFCRRQLGAKGVEPRRVT